MHRHHGIEFESAEECAFCPLLRQIEELDAQVRRQWNAAATIKPYPGVAVLTWRPEGGKCGRTIVAQWWPRWYQGSMGESGSASVSSRARLRSLLSLDYDDEDNAFEPEGWYVEASELSCEYGYILLDGPLEPTHWVPLPERPCRP